MYWDVSDLKIGMYQGWLFGKIDIFPKVSCKILWVKEIDFLNQTFTMKIALRDRDEEQIQQKRQNWRLNQKRLFSNGDLRKLIFH